MKLTWLQIEILKIPLGTSLYQGLCANASFKTKVRHEEGHLIEF